MNKITKMAITAAGIALAAQSAFAGPNNNDLILSINNNNNGGSTEFTVNLGLETSFTAPNGDLSSFMSTFNSTYASAGASGLNVGVAGGQNGQGGLSGAGNDVFTTTMRVGNSGQYTIAGTEGGPSILPTKANIGSAGGVAGGFLGYGANLSVSDPSSFTSTIAKDPTTAGTAANNFTGDLGGDNPLQTMTGSTITLDLWQDTVTSSSTTSGWIYQGDLTVDLSGPSATLTWDSASPVPEPSVYSLFVGAGALAFSFRRRFRRNNA